MRTWRIDRLYWRSILGILELIAIVRYSFLPIGCSRFVLVCLSVCLLFGMICALIASTGWAQQADWVSQICQGYRSNQYLAAISECKQNGTPDAYPSLSANTVKTATIVIFILSLVAVLIVFLLHIFIGFRKRKYWKIATRVIAVILLVFGLMVFSISIAAIFWEVKLSTIFGQLYTSNAFQSTPNGFRQAQTGAAGAAAAFGLIASFVLLIDVICRFLLVGSLPKRRVRRRKAPISVISY